MPWTFLLLNSTYSWVVVQTLSFLLNSVLFIICATVVENSHHGPAFLYCVNTLWYSFASKLLKWLSPPWPWQAGQPPLWVSPGQPATPSATPSLCPTPPKMAPSLSPNLPTVTPPTLWPPSNLAPLTGLRWWLWERGTEPTDRGQRSWGILLLLPLQWVKVRRQSSKHGATFVTALFTMKAYGCRKGYCKCCQPSASLLHVYLCTCS